MPSACWRGCTAGSGAEPRRRTCARAARTCTPAVGSPPQLRRSIPHDATGLPSSADVLDLLPDGRGALAGLLTATASPMSCSGRRPRARPLRSSTSTWMVSRPSRTSPGTRRATGGCRTPPTARSRACATVIPLRSRAATRWWSCCRDAATPPRRTRSFETLRGQLRPVHLLASHPFQLDASVGSACFPHDGRDVATLLAHADRDMYAAKRHANGITPPEGGASAQLWRTAAPNHAESAAVAIAP